MASQLKQIFTGNNTGASALTITMQNTTTGSTIIAAVNGDAGVERITSITDGTNNLTKITAASGAIGGGALSYVSVWYIYNNTAQTTPTFTFTKSAGTGIEVVLLEYTGLTTTDPLDQVARAGGTTTSMSSGSTGTLAQANELVVGIGGDDFGVGEVYTAGSGYGHLEQRTAAAGTIAFEDKVVAATTAVSATFTLSDTTDNATSVLTFKVASVAAPGSPTATSAWLKA